MKHLNIFRHGDVVLYGVDSMPVGEVKKVGSFVLALGDQTNHKHLLTAAPETLIEIVEDTNGKRYIKVLKEAELSHEEHKTITILPGIYEQRAEREFDNFSLVTRQVVD